MSSVENVTSIDQPKVDAFERYKAATARAQFSGRIEDALEAGRAWRGFLDLFLTPEQRDSLANVVPMRRPS